MAGIQSHFEIVVSNKKGHLFATEERSCVTSSEVENVLTVLKEKFPESEGYKISVSFIYCVGYGIDTTKDIGKQVNDIYSGKR